MSDGSSLVAGVKRKMRKGTASCIECRRRKIKCTFIHGDARCANCLARGTQCIDQRDADGVDDYVPDDPAALLGERVAALERQLADVVQSLRDIMQRHRIQALPPSIPDGSDIEPVGAGPGPTSRSTSAVTDVYGEWDFPKTQGEGSVHTSMPERKAGVLCRALRSKLPNFDTLLETFQSHGAWWSHWRRQVQPPGEEIEDITAFIHRTYASPSPGDLGCLVTAHARQMWKGALHLYGHVESLVASDAMYSSTVEGVECLILLAQCYMDIGQPRRAWLTYQRGIALARVMGLGHGSDHGTKTAAKKATLWWSIYLGDRLSSMVLGLPSGVNDFHLGLDIGSSIPANAPAKHQLMVRCAVVAGRIMDRSTHNGAPFSVGISHTEDLEAEMAAISASVPQGWWTLADTTVERLPAPGPELDEVRAQLVQQSYFFQVRMYINLSHLGEAPSSPHWQSKTSCMEAARQLLKRSVLLSAHTRDHRIFECKTNDFIGFIAASVLTIGLSSLGNGVDQSVPSQDQFLIDNMRQNFQQEEMTRRCQIAHQCGHTLELLQTPRGEHDALSDRIIIPYFGTVVRKSHQQTNIVSTVDTALQTIESRTTDWIPPCSDSTSVPALGVDGQPAPDLFSDKLYWELESNQGYFTRDLDPTIDAAMVDLSQDWTLFSAVQGSPAVRPT